MTPDSNTTYLVKMLAGICEDIILKCTATGVLVVSHFLFDEVLAKAMLALFVLVIFDWASGTMASYKTGTHIKSAMIFRTPVKLVVYFMLITGARIAEYSLTEHIQFIDETVIAFLVVTELISLVENVGKMGFINADRLLKKLDKLK